VADGIEQTLRRLERLRETTTDERAKAELTQIEKDLREHLQTEENERNKLLEQLHAGEGRIAELRGRIAQLEETTAEQGKLIEELRTKKPSEEAPTSTVSPLDVANAFKQVVEKVQAEARQTGGVGTTIKSLDIEVKGFVQVQEGEVTALAFPQPDAEVQPDALSTLRVSFGAIPVASPPPEAEEPKRAATPRRRRRT
jgi:predicted nuclease with TOPRIM domain